MIENYWYNQQLRSYIKQFCAIFSGMHVKTGAPEKILPVPIVVGNKDRVVAAIMSRHTQNLTFSLPIMAAHLEGIELAPERRKGVSTIDRRVFMEAGGVFPDDLRVVRRVMPIPYNVNMQLSIYASNTDQLHQIVEQILLIFDPTVQIQKNDSAFDWTKITHVELTGISNNENYPVSTDKRIINWDMSFMMPIYISAPLEIRDEIIRTVKVRLGDLENFNILEYDENGESQPFQEIYTTITTTEEDVLRNLQ